MTTPIATSADDPTLGLAGSAGFIRAVAGFLVVAGLGLAAVRFAGGSPAEDGIEGALGALALGAPIMATGALALLALRERAALLLPAAIVLVPMSFLSFALVTLPLLVPAVSLAIGYGRRSRLESGSAARTAVTVVVVVALLLAAVVALFVHEDPREYSTATVSGGTSDIITAAEAALSLALTGAGVTAGWLLAGPTRRAPGQLPRTPSRSDRTR